MGIRNRFTSIIVGIGCAVVAIGIPWQIASAQKDAAIGNLLKNSDVEIASTATTFPSDWDQGTQIDGVEYIWADTVGYKSKHSLCIKKTAQRYFPIAGWYQEIPYDGSAAKLRVSAYVRADSVTKAVLDVEFEGDKPTHQWVVRIGPDKPTDAPISHDWKLYTGSVDVPAGTKKISIGTQVYGPGTIWFDDITAKYVSAAK